MPEPAFDIIEGAQAVPCENAEIAAFQLSQLDIQPLVLSRVSPNLRRIRVST